MKIVIDTNILMAGLLKDSTIRFLLTSTNINFFLPEHSISEIKKYEELLLEKSGYSKEELKSLMNRLLKNIKIIPKKKYVQFIAQAQNIMKNIDIKDSPFIACALTINAEGIWSFDKHFQMQTEIKVFTIEEIIYLL